MRIDVLLGLVRRLCQRRLRPENRHPLRLERRVGCELQVLEVLEVLEVVEVRSPLSTSSTSSTSTTLSLTKLEPLSRFRPSRLLPLDRPRVAREQAEIAQLPPVCLIEPYECASHGEAQRARLTAHAAAIDARPHVEAPERVSGGKWLLDRRDQRRPREVITERAPVDVPFARARLQIHPADALL